MPIPFFPTTLSIFQTLLGYPWPDKPVEEPSPDAAKAREAEYAHRAGCRLGAEGEWIAELSTESPDKH